MTRALPLALALLTPALPARADDECPEPAGELALVLPQHERCRPRPSDSVSVRFGAEALIGGTDRDVGLAGATAGLAVPVDVGLLPWLMVGARAQWTAVGDARRDADGDLRDDANTRNHHALMLTAGPRLVLHTEPARREAFRVEAGAGWMGVLDDVAPSGPVVEVALARQAGSLTVAGPRARTGTGWEVALSVRGQQGVGDASDYRALLVGATVATELFVPLPEGPRPRRTRPDVEYTLGADVDAGIHFASLSEAPEDQHAPFIGAVGLWLGYPLGTALELRARTEALHVGGPGPADDAVVFDLLGGVRVSRWFPIFAEAYVGWAAPFGTEPGFLEPAWMGEASLGFQIPNAFDCGLGFYGGQRVRFGGLGGTANQDGFFSIGVALGVSYDNLVRAAECTL